MSNPRPLATREEIAEYLQVTVKTLDNWRRAGDGPPWHRLGKGRDSSIRYFWDEVEAWVREPKEYTKPGEDGPSFTLTGEEALDALRELDRVVGRGEPDPDRFMTSAEVDSLRRELEESAVHSLEQRLNDVTGLDDLWCMDCRAWSSEHNARFRRAA